MASVLFRCISAAGSAQEDEVCEDILQRNVVLITPLVVLESLFPIYDFRRVKTRLFDALGNFHKTRFLPLLYKASLVITILPISVQLSIPL